MNWLGAGHARPESVEAAREQFLIAGMANSYRMQSQLFRLMVKADTNPAKKTNRIVTTRGVICACATGDYFFKNDRSLISFNNRSAQK